ncbi:Quinolinate synthase A [Candidatus Gugararchaeum adminiculabundum]|nr:Quinolinate synthase A [Candidatus Gugararchaeum adminiculabundum]
MGKVTSFSKDELERETQRLFSKLQLAGWNRQSCALIAPLTLEINKLKKEKNAIILAHTYVTPDLIFGVADFTGDSYALSKNASETKATTIVFAGVRFMAETAKILNPQKTVLIPSLEAGCSLADHITADDVRKLKKQHPGVPVICYVNTSAEVKAESDVCCTSANAGKIIKALPGKEVIFLPDYFMAKNLTEMTGKKVYSWDAKCIVHEDFDAHAIEEFRKEHPGLKILAHTECEPAVVHLADLAGGTSDMVNYVKKSDAKEFMLVTECGLGDRMRVEFPGKKFIGSCGLCPYMKKNSLATILQALKNPSRDQVVEIPEEIRLRAKKALDRMFELS